MEYTKPKEKTVKKNVLIDVHVEADLRAFLWGRYKSVEEEAKALERACKEFVDFLRDHRSQDLVTLDVVREYENQCSVCQEKWEIAYDEENDNKPYCANCGADLDENPDPTGS
jgi:hypothetical protein